MRPTFRRSAWSTARTDTGPRPAFRRLRGYAFDPSLSTQLETALINEIVFRIPWEEDGRELQKLQADNPDALYAQQAMDDEPDPEPGLFPGPVGEYLEVVDYDPATGCFYEPIDLNTPNVLAQDGLDPSEGNPQFHQQMVYAVAMTTIRNFERALGRFALWAPDLESIKSGQKRDEFVRRLRIYPHALREANAYYSPKKKALLFGYFPAAAAAGRTGHFPGGMVFTCLSHDIITHETTHALLDGMHRRYIQPTNPDALAFHEAFADIVALFQHFTFPEVLRHQIARTRGDLSSQSELGQLAQQFGQAIGKHGALRGAIGEIDPATSKWRQLEPDPDAYQREFEPHKRGSILVAAVFDAFLAIYRSRVADLLRIASSGTGRLAEGALHPDLVNRLATEAAKSAQHVLYMCIRALDYCPPVDITFGEYLRAIITADTDLVPEDALSYRVAFIESFRRRGIYPTDVRTLSVDALRWSLVSREDTALQSIRSLARTLKSEFAMLRTFATTRHDYYDRTKELQERLHTLIRAGQIAELEKLCGGALCLTEQSGKEPPVGLSAKNGQYPFEVHSVRSAQRVGPDGQSLNHAIVVITQRREVPRPESPGSTFEFRGGVTLIFDLDSLALQYVIYKSIGSRERLQRQLDYLHGQADASLRGTYLRALDGYLHEPFSLLHQSEDGRSGT